LGGKPAYERRRVKGRSPRQTRHSVASALSWTNDIETHVFGSDARRQALLIAKFDNLGEGASGAAVLNLMLMLGR
jgi:N-acetyl-gamma-glutamyl-phosphate reductase